MGCTQNVEWIISVFKCLDCGTTFKAKHRKASNKVRMALKYNHRCTGCGGRNYDVTEEEPKY